MVAAVIRGNSPAPIAATTPNLRAPSDIGRLAEAATTMGCDLWPWQAAAAEVALERRADGRLRYPVVTVCVPRQSGKTTLVGLLAFMRCIAQREARVFYTAQTRMDAMGRFRDFVRIIRRSSMIELPNKITNVHDHVWDYRIRMSVGAELIEFGNGSTFQVFSPYEDALHGSVADLVVFDEARFFDEKAGRDLMAAALPTMATRDGQLWIISTGGGPESTFLAAELERSRTECNTAETRRAHFEYGIGYDVADYELLDKVWDAHPAAGQTGGPHYDALAVAAANMDPTQFAHEYGNRWRSADEARLIPRANWEAGLWAQAPTGDVFVGVDVAVDRSSAAVVACIENVLVVLDYRPGVMWLGDRVVDVAERYAAKSVWIDPSGPAGATAMELAGRIPDVLHAASTREMCAACGGFEDALTHDPPLLGHVASDALDASVAAAAHRRIGQAWQWSRVESGPIILAATLAHGALRASVTNPTPVPMVW